MLEIGAHRSEYLCHWNLSTFSCSCSVLLGYQFSISGFLCLGMRGRSRRDPCTLELIDPWGTLMWTFTLHLFTECLMCVRHCVRPWKLGKEHRSVRWQQILQEWDSTLCSDAQQVLAQPTPLPSLWTGDKPQSLPGTDPSKLTHFRSEDNLGSNNVFLRIKAKPSNTSLVPLMF